MVPHLLRQLQVVEGVAQVGAVADQLLGLVAGEERQGLAGAQPHAVRSAEMAVQPAVKYETKSIACLREEASNLFAGGLPDGVLDDAARLQVPHEARILRDALQPGILVDLVTPDSLLRFSASSARGRNGR